MEQNYYLVFAGIVGCISLALLFGEIQMTLSFALKKSQAHEHRRDEVLALLVKYQLP
jgi:hypothetical protein